MSASPYMRWNPAHYFADTHHLDRSQHGAYMLLLNSMWCAGGRLPSNPKNLARLALCTDAEWADMKSIILPFFKREGAFITQKRITEEVAHIRSVTEQRIAAGKLGVDKKRSKNNAKKQANGSPDGKQMPSNSSHIKTPTEEEVIETSSSDRNAQTSSSPANRQPKSALEDGQIWQAQQIERLAARQAVA